MFFRFHDPGPLADGDLHLVPPALQYVDEMLAACHHPLTQQLMPREAAVTQEELLQVIDAWPGGRQPGKAFEGVAPAYHFWMRVVPVPAPGDPRAASDRPRVAGGLALRIGHSRDLEYYYGHVGYHVYPASRGHHYAERAVRLVMPLAKSHGMRELFITCNPDNAASRRTCERLGGRLLETLDVPQGHPLFLRGERRKCRYGISL